VENKLLNRDELSLEEIATVVTDRQEETVEFAASVGVPLSNGGMPRSTDRGTDSHRRILEDSTRTESNQQDGTM
jgi:hypothetical protein